MNTTTMTTRNWKVKKSSLIFFGCFHFNYTSQVTDLVILLKLQINDDAESFKNNQIFIFCRFKVGKKPQKVFLGY